MLLKVTENLMSMSFVVIVKEKKEKFKKCKMD